MERKFAVCRGPLMLRVYWNVENRTWGPLHKMFDDKGVPLTFGATIFNDYGSAKFLADRLEAETTAVWVDKEER